ncbi:ABC transporter ATP-binding protein [Alkalimarinus sediminis]|uniref:ABC transporter ATP-binding protein n=1 Tax=Alkalimarinus sediminis TaxID=1632866 RepID=A0A9E8HJJ0_9ALTE|nr:ABC transporter ATP-binding protein [Alkalimarinus sediminis]UZW75564.1 ABC transporter ATP-binding protein [Alkalimarinus sediminis]
MIQISELTRKFGPFTAVNKVSFDVKPGEVLGFLGPNGAGKSTTMKMITGFLTPTTGEVSVMGQDVTKNPLDAQKQMGYLPEGAPSYGDMTVLNFLRFIGKVRGFKGDELEQRINKVVSQVALSGVLNQRIETLSKGFKRRVGIAQAIIHDPQVLILDEPTDGLDPNQKHQVRELIRNLAKDKIVIISTHILEEVSAVCSRALIIASGSIVFDGTPAELAAKSKFHNAVSVKFTHAYEVKQKLESLVNVYRIECDEESGLITVFPEAGKTVLKQVNELIHAQDWEVEELHVEKGRLDDVFRQVTVGEVA